MRLTLLVPIVGFLASGLAACGSSSPTENGSESGTGLTSLTYDATVQRGSFGVPHITAADYGSIGYGYGYIQAEDNLCIIAEDMITTKGQRALHFGRDGTYTIHANGNTSNNVDSDFFWRHVVSDERIQALADGASPEAAAASAGYAAGFSRYVREIQNGQHAGRHLRCRDAAWIEELTLNDMYRRYFRLSILASSSVFVSEIGSAQPPVGGGDSTSPFDQPEFPLANGLDIGSNMYALSGDITESGESMLFGNPHFPWEGTERLYQAHLTIPGELDIMGSALYAVPAALIGFNRNVAWSHTVSTAYRFTFYELTLAPGDPTSYIYDGATLPMESQDYTVEILETDGSISEETRTLYKSRFGPMLTLTVSGAPVLPWTTNNAYTLRDANAENTRLINQFFEWNRADSLDDFIALQSSVLGVPWVNTAATGPGGRAYYSDVTVVPNVSDAKVTACPSNVSAVFAALVPGLPVLNGSQASCEWDTDDDAPAPGIFGPGNLPSLQRDDWVHNCNDSYWLSNPAEPLTGFAAIIGDEEAERSLRTRLCALHVLDRLDGTDGRPGTEFASQEQLQDIVLSSEVYTERLARTDVLNNVCSLGTIPNSDLTPTDVSEACTVLANWDGTNNLDSVGGHIWREFWRRADDTSSVLWLTPFNAADPVNTPANLNTANPDIQTALADAVTVLNDRNVPLDAAMRDLQVSVVHNTAVPIFGGEGFEGSFTIAGRANLNNDGIYPVIRGNSYIQTVTWDENGDPIAEGFVTYSESTDPASPFFQDMTEAYSNKQWIPWRFTPEQIAADPNLGEAVRLTE